MSDEMPGWARAMESRIGSRLDASDRRLQKIETKEDVEKREHQLIEEISKAIADSEERSKAYAAELHAEVMRRFDQVHDDLTVNLARADVAIERVQRLEGDVRKELSQLQRRLRELEHWRDHRPT